MSLRLLPLFLWLSLFLWFGTVNAATNVNISVGQQEAIDPAVVRNINGNAPAELRAGPNNAKYQSDFSFRNDAKGANYQFAQGSARLTAPNEGRRTDFSTKQSASARLREQDRQNQEFERYIQNYHSGPTVETVFESATPSSSSQRQKSFSSSSTSNGGQSQRLVAYGSRPSQAHSFERQVSLPSVTATPTATLLPPSDDRQTHTIVNHQPKTINVDGGLSSSSSSTPSFDQNGYDSTGTSFNRPNYGYDDSDIQQQYPPTVDESNINFGSGGNGGNTGSGGFYSGNGGSTGSGGFYSGNGGSTGSGGFYSGNEQPSFGGSTPAPGYLPSYPRPVVTKTIQIAQPALKAKKFEIRHPAVQKEFYDIEERVVIKPAGTIVVELERPVAKIAKGETVLPLGHPHPAVASAYNTNGAAIVQTAGSDVTGNNQYNPSPVYSPKVSSTGSESQYPVHGAVIGSTTIASAVTTTPSYDTSSQDDFVEANLNKQYNSDSPYVTTTDRNFGDDKQSNDGFYATTTETSRNYGSQFYGRDETDRRYPTQNVGNVEVKNNGVPGLSNAYAGNKQYNSFGINSQPSYAPSPVAQQYQPNFNDNNNQFNGEFYSGEFYNQGPKPARLQEQPRMRGGSAMQVIKHEHNIHLPPSQHNIYLNRLEQDSSFNGRSDQQRSAQLRSSGPRYNEEAAQVLQIKPFLKHHPGSVVVYASPKVNQPTSSSFNGRYSQPQQQQFDRDYSRYVRPAEERPQSYGFNNVQYSAPYTSMRYYSDQSPRYVYGNEFNYKDKSANLAVEGDNPNDGYQSDAPAKAADASAQKQQAHIQIQIPHHPKEVGKPIVVTSTISPVVHNVDEGSSADYRTTAAQKDKSDFDGERFTSTNDNYKFSPNEFDQNARFEPSQTNGQSLRIIESQAETFPQSSGTGHNAGNVDVNLKSTHGHVATPGSRVIAATPAPTDAASASESFHKRRIVVNHPFQTVREVVEHEPITNYHHVQVNEPASPELYHHTAPYYQQETHGAFRQAETVPGFYHHHTAQTHGNLRYAPVVPLVHGVTVDYHQYG